MRHNESSMLKLREPIAAIVTVAAALFAWALSDGVVAEQIPDVSGWKLFWHDEFDGTTPNTKNWEALDRQNSFNNEKQYYCPEQVTVVNGNLRLTATNQPMANKLYRSG